MSTARQLHYTYEDYLVIERDSDVRHDFQNGVIYAMAGGTPEHAALGYRVARLLESVLRGCTPMNSDARVRIEQADLTTYTDASFVCGPVQRATVDRLAITNPTILVEVTSPSTVDYDRSVKLPAYQQIPSLEAVVLVSHSEPRVTVVERTPSGWTSTDFGPGTSAHLSARDAAFPVDELYDVLRQLAP
ncbi:MAG: Uma2 family endonuclease [Archangium sp.]|nr:Uma2 family endonuclease [Archangium sp.]